MISDNIRIVKQNIAAACRRVGRDPSEVTLIAVSKTKPLPMLKQAYQAGMRDFGENKVQELLDKQEGLPEDARWHMIGHLQRNKVKNVLDKTCLIHSVDSFRLAEEINHQSLKKGMKAKILVEINIASEGTKFGIGLEDAYQLVTQIAALPHLQIEGLMTIPPFAENGEENRQYFRQIKELSVDIQSKNIDNVNMGILSMGMSGDYETAVEEGATMVRVGTGIFGARIYQRKEIENEI